MPRDDWAKAKAKDIGKRVLAERSLVRAKARAKGNVRKRQKRR